MITPQSPFAGAKTALPANAKFIVAFSLLYLAAWWPMLLYNYWQWDDLVWRDLALAQADLASFPRPYIPFVYGSLDHLQNWLPFVRVSALAAFVLNYFAWLAIYLALRLLKFFRHDQLFWIVVLSAVAPVDMTRVTLAVSQYQIAFFFFSLGMLCFFAAIMRRNTALRVLAALWLLASCQIESFYFATMALFLGVLLVRPQWRSSPDWRERLKATGILLAKHGELVLIPIVSFVTRPAGAGAYADYNAVTLNGLISGAPSAFVSAVQTLYEIPSGLAHLAREEMSNAAGLVHVGYYPIILVVVLICIWATRLAGMPLTDETTEKRPGETFAGALCAFLLLAFFLYPYVALVHFVRPFTGFNDRGLLTSVLAIGLFFVLFVGATVRENARIPVLTGLLVVMVSSSALGVIGFIRNAQVTDGIVVALRDSEQVRRETTFVFDPVGLSLAYDQNLRDYEVNAMLGEAFGDHTRMAVSIDFAGDWPSYLTRLRKFPNRGAAGNDLVQGKVLRTPAQWLNFHYRAGGGRAGRDLLAPAVLWRSWLKLTAPARYQMTVGKLVEVTVGPSGPVLSQTTFGP